MREHDDKISRSYLHTLIFSIVVYVPTDKKEQLYLDTGIENRNALIKF